MKILTSLNTNNLTILSQMSGRNPINLDLFINSMKSKGYEYCSPWDENTKALKHGNATYPTFISPDGQVKLAFERNTLFFHNYDVWYGDSSARPNVIILQGIVTSTEARGKGLASKALQDFKSSALENGFEIQLEPVPMKQFIEKKKPSLNQKQLTEWYKRHGFGKKYPDSERILTTKEPTEPAKTIE